MNPSLATSPLDAVRVNAAADPLLHALGQVQAIERVGRVSEAYGTLIKATGLRAAIGELCRVVRPGGRVAFTTLLAGSLPELNQAWQAIDDRPHANRFLSEPAVRAALSGLRAEGIVHQISLPFADALSAMRSLKGIGATHLHQGRTATPLGRGKLRELQLAWPQRQGVCPLTYSLFTGVIERD